MTPRDQMQIQYELAFHPPRLFALWRDVAAGRCANLEETGEWLDAAWLLHQALPEQGYASQRALTRLALYQARARAFGMVGWLRALRTRMGRPPLAVHAVPAAMVRDIGLPPLARRGGA